jgi:hypothetical protein
MTYEPYAATLHRIRADELERDAVASSLTRGARRARRLELAARLFDRLARRLEARAGSARRTARARML